MFRPAFRRYIVPNEIVPTVARTPVGGHSPTIDRQRAQIILYISGGKQSSAVLFFQIHVVSLNFVSVFIHLSPIHRC